MQAPVSIPGYDFGTARVGRSPVTLDELRQLEQAADFTEKDQRALQRAADVLGNQAEQMVDSWRARIAAQPELARWFFGPQGKPDEAYKAAVKSRFVQWVHDTCVRPHDQAWLDYQEEIGLRHTPARKNKTDGAHTPPQVPLRYLIAFVAVVSPIRPFLSRGGHSAEEVEEMQAAWSKAVLIHISLWSRPYVREGLW
ncbi:MAG TPA: protoglobin domain-containing protein [Terriglobales bacterium]|nr:protoglobin domain-containing protein [Terriglobales bacterium]